MKRFSWGLSIFYLVFLYGWIGFDVFLFSRMGAESVVHIPVLIIVLINILFFTALMIAVITQSIRNIFAIRNKNINYCINSYLFYKYAAIPVILTAIFISLYIMLGVIVITPMSFVMPQLLLILPFLWAFAFIMLPIVWTFAIIADIPSFIASVCILAFTKSENKISLGKCILHFILQIIPIVDIIDGFYISIKYWKKGRVLAIVTAVCSFIIIAILAFIYSGTKSLG